MTAKKIINFTYLIAWQKSHQVVLKIYQILDTFPKKEQFALCDQMRRASISITSNIAEGFTRQNRKEKIQFYFFARSSLTELQNQLILAKDVKYITTDFFEKIFHDTEEISRLLLGLIRSAQSK